jgi:Zn-dependent oligopeptidase
MAILKKVLSAAIISTAMLTSAPTVMAAGKIEKATMADVTEAVEEAVRLSDETVAAIKEGAEKDTIMNLFKETKQASKKIESNVVDRLRQKANETLRKARSKYKKGETEEALTLMTKAAKIFKDIKAKRNAF